MNTFLQEQIEDKIKQTEEKMLKDDDDEKNKLENETPEEKEAREITEIEAIADIAIENERIENEKKDKQEKQQQETYAKELAENIEMSEEDIDYTDPMNSLAGPKKELIYGNLEDQEDIDRILVENPQGKPQGTVKMYDNTFKVREEKEILDEIDRDIQNYVVQGEWVYCLYSVLIHSGGVSGGHYSAYIKSFEDNQWYHFNDSTVSEISVADIEEMHGDGRSSKNAYLVIYKKLNWLTNTEKPEVEIRNSPVITNEEIPDYITEEILKDNNIFKAEIEVEKRMEKERLEREAEITLRLFWKSHSNENSTENIFSNQVPLNSKNIKIVEKKFDFNNKLTLKLAHEEGYKLYGLEKLGINIEDTRIRTYNVGLKILKNSFEDKNNWTLKELGIDMSTPLFLETKKPEETFDSFNSETIPLRYYLWNEGIESLEESYLNCNIIFVNKNNTVNDLEQDIIVNLTEKGLLKEDQSFENIAIFIEKYSSGGVNLREISTPDQKTKNFASVHIYEGTRIFVDFRTNPEIINTNWEIEFLKHSNRWRISFNNPFNGPVDQWANDEYRSFESTYENTLFMESGQTLLELKMNISKVINLDIGEFRIMKSGIRYEEIRDLSQTLEEARLGRSSRVFIELGKPVSVGSHNVLLYEAVFNHEEDNELFKYSNLILELNVEK